MLEKNEEICPFHVVIFSEECQECEESRLKIGWYCSYLERKRLETRGG